MVGTKFEILDERINEKKDKKIVLPFSLSLTNLFYS